MMVNDFNCRAIWKFIVFESTQLNLNVFGLKNSGKELSELNYIKKNIPNFFTAFMI